MLSKLKGNPTFIMVCCALLWSTGGLLLKSIEWNSLVIGSFRGMVTALVMFIYMKSSGLKITINKQTLLAGLMYGGTTVAYVIANKLTTAANAIVIQSANPIFIILLSVLIFRQRILKKDMVVVIACTIGIGLFFLESMGGGGMMGNFAALISAFFIASAYTASAKAKDESATMSGIMIGHVVTIFVGLPMIFVEPPVFTTTSVITILFLGVFQLALPYILFSKAIRLADPLTCSLVGMIEPIANPLWVAIAVGEIPGLIALIGGAIVLGSIAWWSLANSKVRSST